MTLFDSFDKNFNKPDFNNTFYPLAERLRPTNLEDFVGQDHILGEGKVLRNMIESDNLSSMIFWGPPGSGKTTIASIIKLKTRNKFLSYSAVTSGIKQIKEIMDLASKEIELTGLKTILFIDEIHRFNKAQQDAFLPFIETGKIILIGSSTENPSFEINSALLSRCKVYIFYKLTTENIITLLRRALSDKEKGFGKLELEVEDEALALIAQYSDGDARIAYNILELAVQTLETKNLDNRNNKKDKKISILDIENIIQKKVLLYDKNGEEHYNLISALHKSMRGSDPDASAYWTIRMLESGEDPLYIIRRIVRFASEDIGLADPNALSVSIAAKQAFEFIGPPEGYLAIIEAAIYCALAPKSNSLYLTYNNVMEDINKHLSLPVPMHIRNAPTKLMKEIGYGKNYKYPHNFEDALVNQSYLPDEISRKRYYLPTERGFEKVLKERLAKINEYKKRLQEIERKNKEIK